MPNVFTIVEHLGMNLRWLSLTMVILLRIMRICSRFMTKYGFREIGNSNNKTGKKI